MEDWRERLRNLYLEENSEITSPNSILFNWGEFLFKSKTYQNFYLATQDSIEEFIEQELSKAREEGRMSAMNELKRAFSKVFYRSGELWFDYLFEEGDTKAEEDAKAVIEEYWKDILSKFKDNK